MGEELLAKSSHWHNVLWSGYNTSYWTQTDLSELLGRHAAFTILSISACPTKVTKKCLESIIKFEG